MPKRTAPSETLIQAVDRQTPKLRTKSLDLSFNELATMYQGGELIIKPEYQRLFRWSEQKQSRFVESLLLEMPIPPIFVIEREDGTYELIDGLQRISSYLHFRGMHEDRKDQHGKPTFLTLTECDILDNLNGLTWKDLPTALQIRIKRYFVRVEVIKKESDHRLRYDIFKRLNTGGEILSEQEIRNCSIRLLDSTFIDFVNDLSKNPDYKVCMKGLSVEAVERRQDQEYVLRFFAFKNHRSEFRHEVGEFMTEYMEAVADPESDIEFDYAEEKQVFERTFKTLRTILGDDVFSRYAMYNKKPTPVGQLRPNYFEAFALGIQKRLPDISLTSKPRLAKLRDEFVNLRFNNEFSKVTGAGVNYPKPLNRRIELVEEAVERALS